MAPLQFHPLSQLQCNQASYGSRHTPQMGLQQYNILYVVEALSSAAKSSGHSNPTCLGMHPYVQNHSRKHRWWSTPSIGMAGNATAALSLSYPLSQLSYPPALTHNPPPPSSSPSSQNSTNYPLLPESLSNRGLGKPVPPPSTQQERSIFSMGPRLSSRL